MKLKYIQKTLADVLNEHPEYKTVLLKFYHGLGDAIDFFANCVPMLKRSFPGRRFYVETQLGQEYFFGEVDPDENHYDLCVFIAFPCAEWDEGPETKAEKCARVELGIKIPPDVPSRYFISPGRDPSPLVGVHFVSTSNDDVSCPEPCARMIWDKIEQRGLMNALGGFAGVSSGNFWAALCTLPPSKILFIETEFPVQKITHIPIRSVKAADPDEAVIDAWLNVITEGMHHV